MIFNLILNGDCEKYVMSSFGSLHLLSYWQGANCWVVCDESRAYTRSPKVVLDLNLFNNIELTFACQRGFLFFAGPKIKKQKKGPKPAKLALALLLLLGMLLSSISLYVFLPAMATPQTPRKTIVVSSNSTRFYKNGD